MRRFINIIICTFLFNSVFAQNIALNKELFQCIQESSIYKYYSEKELVVFWIYRDFQTKGVDIDTSYFGFYNSCELPNLDSLKQSGANYFEVDSRDFTDEATTLANMYNNCSQLSFLIEGKDTLMNIYYSSRQQYVTYRKVHALPRNVQDYLEKKGIRIFE
ncbi:MAG: hypothetical protein AB9846_02395 [Tenuifilaceae bacterium]